MAKVRSQFICRSCGSIHPRWIGKCPDCNAWDSLEKVTEPSGPQIHPSLSSALTSHITDETDFSSSAPIAQPLPDIPALDVPRIPTRITEFDRVLGGGLVPGSVILVGGDPGIGKSTLLLQAAAHLAAPSINQTSSSSSGSQPIAHSPQPILYVSAEESAFQTKLRASRLLHLNGAASSESAHLNNLFILADTNLSRILQQARTIKPSVLVIDSIQMVHRPDLPAAPGSVTQLRRCCTDLVYLAKSTGIAVLLVGHVTKDGQVAGPKLIEHLVDAVLLFEGDRHHSHRVIRSMKNRFGTTLEVGLFEMSSTGLIEVTSLSALLDPDRAPQPGSVPSPVLHGSRCLIADIQALTATGILGAAKRKASGVDVNRLSMLIAVLEKHAGLRLADQDVYVSSAAGLKVTDPSADLAIALAIAGVHLNRALPRGTAVLGELALSGELLHAQQLESRVLEASRLGYSNLLIPAANKHKPPASLTITPIRSFSDAMNLLSPVPAKRK